MYYYYYYVPRLPSRAIWWGFDRTSDLGNYFALLPSMFPFHDQIKDELDIALYLLDFEMLPDEDICIV